MSVRRFIADASPLIVLTRIGRLDLLDILPRPVVVPGAVRTEIRAKGRWNATARALRSSDRFRIQDEVEVSEAIERRDLGPGETEVLALAGSSPRTAALIDDRNARRCADDLGIPFMGTAGLVLKAKHEGVVGAAAPILEELVEAGMYLDQNLRADLLRHVGE